MGILVCLCVHAKGSLLNVFIHPTTMIPIERETERQGPEQGDKKRNMQLFLKKVFGLQIQVKAGFQIGKG